jgi:allophanate hydrolase subunit 2
MGSRSFYSGITACDQLTKGFKIPYFAEHQLSGILNSTAKWSSDWYQTELLTAYPGPDFKLLSRQLKETLADRSFQISPLSNRMGTQLVELLENDLPELPTNPVFPGTVQLTSGGKLIVLGQDAQVTGGYPRILQLTEESRWILAQKKPGSSIRFELHQPAG